jgi:threonine dehydrogenase-like Zn-dependent dehydrogenase
MPTEKNMMEELMDRLNEYKLGQGQLPEKYLALPVYGAGLENVGDEAGRPIYLPMNAIGPDELLIRHDADSICFSDIKVINQGQEHPRIYQNMKEDPVVLGHELTMTIVKVGDNLKDQYKPGQRFTIQADIYEDGVSYAYGYYYQGAMSQYGVVDARILHSDGGNNNLLPLLDTTGYAEGALAEPWACVVAAYGLDYRNTFQSGGIVWFIGANDDREFVIDIDFVKKSAPEKILVTNIPEKLTERIKALANDLGILFDHVSDIHSMDNESVDDIILFGYDQTIIVETSQKLKSHGVFCLMTVTKIVEPLPIDLGRVHYQRWLYVADTGLDFSVAYENGLKRNTLKPGGSVLFAGAGGPIGRMHVQRAIEFQDPPATIVCTDVSDLRLEDLRVTYADQAQQHGIEIIFSNPMKKESYQQTIGQIIDDGGFDDIVVLAPVPRLIEEITGYVAEDGLVNVFAGIARGTTVNIDFHKIVHEGVRYIGHSGSALEDMQMTLDKIQSKELNAGRTIAAVGSLHYGKEGLQAVKDAVYPGKVVIFNHIKEFPITPLEDFKEKLPSVYALFDNGEWTNAAEEEFLRIMLADR